MAKVLVLANSISGLISFRKEVMDAIAADGHEVVIAIPQSNDMAYAAALKARLIPLINLNRRGINPFTDIILIR